jgi:hypothetical protein
MTRYLEINNKPLLKKISKKYGTSGEFVKVICEQPNTKAHGLDTRKEISSSASTFIQKCHYNSTHTGAA